MMNRAEQILEFDKIKELWMSETMLNRASEAAYGKSLTSSVEPEKTNRHQNGPKVQKHKMRKSSVQSKMTEYSIGDSVIVYPEKKIGIVCQTTNEKGVLRVQVQKKKLWINQKRVKLHVAAKELYPEDYDFSIIFDSVENRKIRHEMERKFVEGKSLESE